jgi:NAD-dependent dihydropyrimidine dehydrogenase PreA subunit
MWKVTVDKDKCTGDGECADVCPVDVYQLIEGRSVILMPSLLRKSSRFRRKSL